MSKPCIKVAFGDDYNPGLSATVVLHRHEPLVVKLINLSACPRSLWWMIESKANTFKEAWDVCPRGDWMAWLIANLYRDVSLVPIQWFARTLIHLSREDVIEDSTFHSVNRMCDKMEANAPFDTYDEIKGWTYDRGPEDYGCIYQYRVFQLALGVKAVSTKYTWRAFSCDKNGDNAWQTTSGRKFLRAVAQKLREIVPFEQVEVLWNKA